MLKKLFYFSFVFSIFLFSQNFADLKVPYQDPSYFPNASKVEGEKNLYRYLIDHLDLAKKDTVLEFKGKGMSKKILPKKQVLALQEMPLKPVDKILSIEEPASLYPLNEFIQNSYASLKPNGKIVFSTILKTEVSDNELLSKKEVQKIMEETGFKDIHLEPIGEYVFPGMDNEKWPRLYTEDLIDYYVVSAYKPIEVLKR